MKLTHRQLCQLINEALAEGPDDAAQCKQALKTEIESSLQRLGRPGFVDVLQDVLLDLGLDILSNPSFG